MIIQEKLSLLSSLIKDSSTKKQNRDIIEENIISTRITNILESRIIDNYKYQQLVSTTIAKQNINLLIFRNKWNSGYKLSQQMTSTSSAHLFFLKRMQAINGAGIMLKREIMWKALFVAQRQLSYEIWVNYNTEEKDIQTKITCISSRQILDLSFQKNQNRNMKKSYQKYQEIQLPYNYTNKQIPEFYVKSAVYSLDMNISQESQKGSFPNAKIKGFGIKPIQRE
ncbi:hypothetical protein ABPG74_003752 [Tetrahymena malaccensis]